MPPPPTPPPVRVVLEPFEDDVPLPRGRDHRADDAEEHAEEKVRRLSVWATYRANVTERRKVKTGMQGCSAPATTGEE